jgi:LacI family transcriptional regulator
VDGVLLYAPNLYMPDDELTAMRGDIPLVRRDYVPGSKLAWVGFDQAHATRLAVEHLIELGHRHIAAIPPSLDVINGYWRYTTWKNVLLEHDLVPGPAAPGNYSMRSGYDGVLEILGSGEPFTAIVVGSDNMALGALRALHENGLRVPDDISVIGYDNTEHSRYTIPQLTTVGFEFVRQDELSVKYLVELVHDPDMELRQRILQGELIVRESTRALASVRQT